MGLLALFTDQDMVVDTEQNEKICFLPGSNRRPCACKAHVITATLRKLIRNIEPGDEEKQKTQSSHLGIEPRTFGLEVQRAILCANGTGCMGFGILKGAYG